MQVITVSGYRVETDEHPWAQAVLTDGGSPLVQPLCCCCMYCRHQTHGAPAYLPILPCTVLQVAATIAVCLSSRNDTVPSSVGVC